MASAKVVVIGAGVSGLTTAFLLSKHSDLEITVVAKHVPGDYDIEYASPWAGANYLPVGASGTALAKYERDTWPELERLANEVPEAAIHFQDTYTFQRTKDAGSPTGNWMKELNRSDAWYKDVVPNFRKLEPSELPHGTDSGITFTSVCINTPVYLSWLQGQCLARGVIFKRAVVPDIATAATLHSSRKPATLVVNCTGLGSLKLGGVRDTTMYPARGQIVVVRNTPGEPGAMATLSGSDDGPEESVYIMNRAAGGGCILGGCLQKGNWESQPDPNLALRIMKRCVGLWPALTSGRGVEALDVVRHGVGLRPMREGGPRVEKEVIDGVTVVHNYGHAGYGYQASYGSAMEAEKLVLGALKERARL
ncbi:D-amino acid oxidase [Lineolata rhizophorae]|uniref:D-amino acid oxidase n=1 Tax=Lineolata rhizophorae TaxID=578093 RepID=A0A6A6P5M6_9PEZI|nr:D-amino acid oxidase [Lineolata rhizophorae]